MNWGSWHECTDGSPYLLIVCLALRALIIFQFLREPENIPQRQGRSKLAGVYSLGKKKPCTGSTEKNRMMIDWNEYQKQIGATRRAEDSNGTLFRLGPESHLVNASAFASEPFRERTV